MRLDRNRNHIKIVASGRKVPSARDILNIGFTFCQTTFAWIFFRSKDLNHAFSYISGIFSKSLFKIPEILPKSIIAITWVFMIIEWFGREQEYALAYISSKVPKVVRWILY
jgi:alginate O-acetyltransferase complex protein AlgI